MKSNEPSRRLPCRGCTFNCKNYASCEGHLWRLAPTQTIDKKMPSANVDNLKTQR